MSFETRITRMPLAYDADRGADAAALVDAPAPIKDLIAGAAGCSPYLASLIGHEAGWIAKLRDTTPEELLAQTLGDVQTLDFEDLSAGFRQAKRRVALLTALADLGGVWPLENVTQALTDLSDTCLQTGLKHLTANEIKRGKLPDSGVPAAGMCILAMGKTGAGELNYSSDIDLICLFDETQFDADTYAQARTVFVKITRALMKLMSDVTADGYVFRTDLRLRPDASITPVCIAMETAERYYESVGRTWERAAFIKARPCAGDIKAGQAFLDRLAPFIWRKHLDFAAIQDAHDMRLQIRDHKGLNGQMRLPGHDMKLGSGGIREIEFFTQTRQLIAGGRDPSLRVRGTVDGLARLADAGWIDVQTATTLSQLYVSHREVEHRLQMIGDAQTHALPTSGEGFDRLSQFMGVAQTDQFSADLEDRLNTVATLTETFFEGSAQTHGNLARVDRYLAQWRGLPALRAPRAVDLFRRVFPTILDHLDQAMRPAEALLAFEKFLGGLPSGVQVFSLFDANPQLAGLIADICVVSPALAEYLSQNASVLDAVIAGDFFVAWPGRDDLSASLTVALARHDTYEAKLEAARRWQKEWRFRIGVHYLKDIAAAQDTARHYAELAEVVVETLLPIVTAEFAVKHGPPPGDGMCVLAMGSLGSARLTATSDLDIITVYDAQGADISDGPKPLPVRSYFARLTQSLITALSARMGAGRLYEVDMRLRPSGQSGPVAVSLDSFDNYQRNEAWVWEHLALTRARVIAGSKGLGTRIASIRRDVIANVSQNTRIRAETSEMRARLAAAQRISSDWQIKFGPGGRQDIALAAQAMALLASADGATDTQAQLQAGAAAGLIDANDSARLQQITQCYDGLVLDEALLGGRDPQFADLGKGGQMMVLRHMGLETGEDLAAVIETCRTDAARIIASVLDHGAGE